MIFYDLLDNRTWNVLVCSILVIHSLQPEGFHDTFSLQEYVQFSICFISTRIHTLMMTSPRLSVANPLTI